MITDDIEQVDQPADSQAPADQGWASTKDVAPPAQAAVDQGWASTSDHTPQRTWADKLGIPRTGGDGRVALGRAAVDAAEGVASGLASTVFHTGDVIRRMTGQERIIDKPETQQRMTAPDSIAGKIGKGAEQVAEFVAPMGAAADLTKGAGLLMRAGTEGLVSGGVSAMQTGGDPGATTMGTLGGAAGPLMGAAGKGIVQGVANKLTSQAPRPLSQEAISLAAKYGVPLTQGMVGGSKTVQAVEKMLGHTVAPDLYEALMEKAQQGTTRAATAAAGGFATDKFAAGDSAVSKLLQVADTHASDARKYYAVLDAAEADPANARQIVNGVDPATGLKIYQTIPLPVDMSPAKDQLKPILRMIKQQLPVGQQQYSKALHAIQNVMDGPDFVPASIAEANLSAIKAIQREALTPKTKMLAGQVLDAMDPEVSKAIATAGPDAANALTAARSSWKNRMQVLDMVDQLSGDTTGKTGQTLAASRLLKPADASYPLLKQVLDTAPAARGDLGNAYLGRVFGKANAGEFTNPNQARNLWNQIGDRTKKALYDPQQIKDIEATLDLAKRIGENPNPSGTGIINSLLKLGILATHPVSGTAGFVFGRNAAKVLYDPAGAAAMKNLFQGTAQGPALTLVKSLIANGAETAGGQ